MAEVGGATLDFPMEAIKGAVCSLLLARGWPEERVRAIMHPLFDLAAADAEVVQALRETSAVILALHARDLLVK